MKHFPYTKVNYHKNKRDDEGNLETYITSEKAFNAATKKATDEKSELPTLVAKQTFDYLAAETVGEALSLSGITDTELCTNVDELVTASGVDISLFLHTFNETDAILKQHNEAADLIKDSNFQAQDGSVSLGYAIAQKSERAKMSPAEKASKELSKAFGTTITPEMLQAALATIMAGQAASA